MCLIIYLYIIFILINVHEFKVLFTIHELFLMVYILFQEFISSVFRYLSKSYLTITISFKILKRITFDANLIIRCGIFFKRAQTTIFFFIISF